MMSSFEYKTTRRCFFTGSLAAGAALAFPAILSRLAGAADKDSNAKYDQTPIVDCHAHFIDARRLHYPLFAKRRAGFEALMGDYTAMARTLLPEDYARDTAGFNVVQVVGEEFLSDDPIAEAAWLNTLADTASRPNGIVALADFLSPTLGQTLASYATMGHVHAVRQHLGWHPANPLISFASRPGLLNDPVWQRGLASLRGRNIRCELEIYSPQLEDFATVAAAFPDIHFILPIMGWPVDLTSAGQDTWAAGMKSVGACPNVTVKIFGMEMIFGLNWTIPQVRPWVLRTIDIFGPGRTMFGSHMPICQLAYSFQHLYEAYFQVIEDFTPSEKRQMLHDTAVTAYALA